MPKEIYPGGFSAYIEEGHRRRFPNAVINGRVLRNLSAEYLRNYLPNLQGENYGYGLGMLPPGYVHENNIPEPTPALAPAPQPLPHMMSKDEYVQHLSDNFRTPQEKFNAYERMPYESYVKSYQDRYSNVGGNQYHPSPVAQPPPVPIFGAQQNPALANAPARQAAPAPMMSSDEYLRDLLAKNRTQASLDAAYLSKPYEKYVKEYQELYGQPQNPALINAPARHPNSELEVKGQAEQRQIPEAEVKGQAEQAQLPVVKQPYQPKITLEDYQRYYHSQHPGQRVDWSLFNPADLNSNVSQPHSAVRAAYLSSRDPDILPVVREYNSFDISRPNREAVKYLYNLEENKLRDLANYHTIAHGHTQKYHLINDILTQKYIDEQGQQPPAPLFGPEERPAPQMNPAVMAANIEHNNLRQVQNAQNQIQQQMMAQQGNNVSLPMLLAELQKAQQGNERHVPIYPKRDKMLEVMKHFNPDLYNPDYMQEEED